MNRYTAVERTWHISDSQASFWPWLSGHKSPCNVFGGSLSAQKRMPRSWRMQIILAIHGKNGETPACGDSRPLWAPTPTPNLKPLTSRAATHVSRQPRTGVPWIARMVRKRPFRLLLRRNLKRFRGGLVVKAHRFVYHSTLGWGVIKKKTIPKKARI